MSRRHNKSISLRKIELTPMEKLALDFDLTLRIEANILDGSVRYSTIQRLIGLVERAALSQTEDRGAAS